MAHQRKTALDKLSKEDFIQDVYNRGQDCCERNERWNSTLNTTGVAGGLEPMGRMRSIDGWKNE